MSEQISASNSGHTKARSEEFPRSSSPTLTDPSSTMSSPRSARKRTNDEIYTSKPGTGKDHSKSLSINPRPTNASEQIQQAVQSPQFEQSGFPQDVANLAAQSFGSTVATLSTQPSNASTALTIPNASPTFVAQLQDLQAQLDREYDKYERELEGRDRRAYPEDFEWHELEARYLEEMEPAIRDEQEIQAVYNRWCRNMILWMQTSSDRETERAIKRLRTRIAFVQTSEEKLAQKEQHYEKVLKAFQSTMALLGGS